MHLSAVWSSEAVRSDPGWILQFRRRVRMYMYASATTTGSYNT